MTTLTRDDILQLLDQVMDPEIPVLSVRKLGIIADVRVGEQGVEVDMVPTFAGCPAIEVMKRDVITRIQAAGVENVTVIVKYKESWSSNQITAEGKAALKEFGISPPPVLEGELTLDLLEGTVCPKCDSINTRLLSSFGPTACRAIHHCDDCHETFEQMKPL